MSLKVRQNTIIALVQTIDNRCFAISKCDCCGKDRGLPCRVYIPRLPFACMYFCRQCAIDRGLLSEEQKDKLPADIIHDK